MKKIFLLLCASVMLFSCGGKKDEKEPEKSGENKEKMDGDKKDANTNTMPQLDSATKAKNWQEYMTPGDMQKMMAAWNGTWTGEVTVWMDPSAPPMKSSTTAVNKMIMNGMYQESDHTGSFGGMPFMGKSITGFDNHRKVFVSSWIDNMGSGIMNMEGPWDAATKTATLKGKMVDGQTRQMTDYKQTFKIIDDKTQLMEMFVMMGDKEIKTMEIKYTRK